MRIIKFMKDLGIVPNKGTAVENDTALHHGQQFMDFNRMYTREISPQYTGLQSTGFTGVGTLVEAMSSAESTSKTSSSEISNRNVSKLEDEFNRTIAEYNTLYKVFSEEILKKNTADKEIRQYYSQAISSSDGVYSYVNDYGYTHKYSKDAWGSNADNCPTVPTNVNNDTMSKFGKGPDMGIGQACGVAGKNIRNLETGEIAWVDIKGYKHIYSNDAWANKQSDCNVPVITISAVQYNAMPSGGAMTTTDDCIQLDVNPNVWKNLMHLNKKLIGIAAKLSKELSNTVVDDVKITMARDVERERMQKYTAQLNHQQSEIALHSQSLSTVDGKESSSKLQNTTALIHLIVWILLLSLVISITVRALVSDESTPLMDGLAVVAAIIILYLVVVYLASRSS
jgi:hypothetical protein